MRSLHTDLVQIPNLLLVLTWILSFLFAGSVVTFLLMYREARLTKDISGGRVNIHRLHLISSTKEMTHRLSELSSEARWRLRKQLRIDFVYMPFAFFLICSISVLIATITCSCSSWIPVLTLLCMLPFLIWPFDLIENFLMLEILRRYNSGAELDLLQLKLMKTASLIKWTLSAIWVLVHLCHGLIWLIAQQYH